MSQWERRKVLIIVGAAFAAFLNLVAQGTWISPDAIVPLYRQGMPLTYLVQNTGILSALILLFSSFVAAGWEMRQTAGREILFTALTGVAIVIYNSRGTFGTIAQHWFGLACFLLPYAVAAGAGWNLGFAKNREKKIKKQVERTDTPLHVAIANGSTNIARQLIEGGADLNALGADDHTPLEIAARRGADEILELLILHGANVAGRNSSGTSALFWAIMSKEVGAAELLIAAGANVNPPHDNWSILFEALEWANPKLAMQAVIAGANPNFSGRNGNTPLHLAASRGYAEIVGQLIQEGAKIDALDSSGRTPLLTAIGEGNVKAAELLIQRGASIKQVGKGAGRDPLAAAAREGLTDIAKLLITKGADVNAQEDSNSRTALMQAASYGHLKIVELLIMNKAKVRTKADKGTTALDCATRSGHSAIVEVLLANGAIQ